MHAEPYGHRGHPTPGEMTHARFLRSRLGAAIAGMQTQGFTHDEAVAFLAGVAQEHAFQVGESWHSPIVAATTVNRLLMEGRAAKWWSMRAIEHAIDEIQSLL